MNKRLYKVLSAEIWQEAESAGEFRGAGIDLQDGFIHLSAADQITETVALHFAGQTNLLLVSIDGDRLGTTLRWETSRNGQLFPHVYGAIPLSAVQGVAPLPIGDDGKHVFPDDSKPFSDTTCLE